MSGLHTNLKDIGKLFEKLKALDAADERKAAVIKELRSNFMREGFSYSLSQHMAEAKYSSIHKTQSNGSV